MNIGSKLAALAAFACVGVAFVLYSVRARTSSTSSSIPEGNNNSPSQRNLGLSILLTSAREYYVKGDYKKADIFFERILEIEPNHIDALNGKGTSLYMLADYDTAKNCFDKVLQMDPKNAAALNNIEILGKKKDDSSQKIERPAPSHDSGTIPRADPRNPYNDPTLPYYNPDLGKKKVMHT
jgi:tetratricopeptide (TPR) repeat protein